MRDEEKLFDEYAADYEVALDQGISISGENKDYFARSRVEWLAHCLNQLGQDPKLIMDFGCGTGSAGPFLLDMHPGAFVVGVDLSSRSIAVAKAGNRSDRLSFLEFNQYQPKKEMDLAFCNGVFHHIQPRQRASAVDYIYRSLRAGGWFAFWENNPWNPGTRYVMSRIPFDRDAITLSAPDARRLLRSVGFEIVRTDFLFLFPRVLRWFRRVEPLLASLPLGAQYQVLCRKP